MIHRFILNASTYLLRDSILHLFIETIKRLAGGRLDVMEGDHDDFNNEESSGESDIVSVSLDDEDEYTTMLDSIPLNTTTPEAIPQVNRFF